MSTIPSNPSLGSLFPKALSPEQSTEARNRRYAEAATEATRVNPAHLFEAADKAYRLMGEPRAVGTPGTPEGIGNRPQLASPRQLLPSDPKQQQDMLTLLMARLLKLLGEVSVNKTQTQLDLLRSMAESASSAHEQRSVEYQQAVAELDSAVAQAQGSEVALLAARERLAAATAALAAAEVELAGLDPDSAEYQAALQARDRAQAGVQQASGQVASAQTHHQRNLDAAARAGDKVQRLGDRLTEVATVHVQLGLNKETEKAVLDELDAAARMTALLFRFAELMGNAQETKLELDQAMFKEMQEARQAYMEVKSKEFQDAVAKAERAKKISGCIGVLVAAIVTVVAAIAVPGIGGIIIGAIGMSLVAMQGLNMAGVTDFDPLAPLMDPLMKGLMFVIEPMGKLLGELWQYTPIGALLNATLPEDAREMANTIVGMAAAMAVLVMAAMLLGPALGSLLSSAMSRLGQVLSKVVGKMVEQFFKPMFAKINEAMADNIAMQQIKTLINAMLRKLTSADGFLKSAFSGPNGQLWVSRLQTAAVAAELGGTAASSGFNVAAGVYRYEAGKAIADVQMLQFLSEQLKVVLAEAVNAFSEQSAENKNFEMKLLDMISQQANAASFIANQKI